MTQNQGNVLGDRPCVRQSKLYRHHDGGNSMKELLGQDALKWDTTRTQGAYEGGRVYDHNSTSSNHVTGQQQQFSNVPLAVKPSNMSEPMPSKGFRRGSGQANKQTYNFLTGE
jgi:hypothetical protein